MLEPFAPGLGRAIGRRLARAVGLQREEALLLDRQYQLWLARERHAFDRHEAKRRVDKLQYRPLISLLVPVFDPDRIWLEGALSSARAQLYPHWELCAVDDGSRRSHVRRLLHRFAAGDSRIHLVVSERNEGICAASNRALRMARGEFIAPLDHDDQLTPDALLDVVEVLNRDPSLDLVYTDHDLIDERGRRHGPFFKPDWSPDLLLSLNYITHFSVMRRSLVDRIGGFRLGFEGAEDFDLFLRLTEASSRIAHVARPLYSWGEAPTSVARHPDVKPYAHEAGRRALQSALERRQIDGNVVDGLGAPYRYRVKRTIGGAPRVSIVVASGGDGPRLDRCLLSLERYRGATDFDLTVCRLGDPSRRSALRNRAAAAAPGDHLLFLDDVVEAVQPGWLDAMLEHSQRREVGAVGPKILASDGTIASAGMTLGVFGAAGPAFAGIAADHPGYYDLARVIRNVSLLTSACMMIRRDTFELFAGFDQSMDGAEDFDLCLRLREKGLLCVYTPYAVTRQQAVVRPPLAGELQRRAATLGARWSPLPPDPYYNIQLTLQQCDFALKTRRTPVERGLRRQRLRFRRYFNGRGLELGALHDPMAVDARYAVVTYVDHLTPAEQRVHYPELAEYPLAEATVLADARQLPVRDASQDFVIASQLLQQLPDPIGALIEWRRVLVPGGLLFLAIPDSRKTGERSRPRTTLAHLVADHGDGGASTRPSHYDEHVAATALPGGMDAHEYARRLMVMKYGISLHVWAPQDIHDVLVYMHDTHEQPWKVVRWLEPRRSDEFFVVLRK